MRLTQVETRSRDSSFEGRGRQKFCVVHCPLIEDETRDWVGERVLLSILFQVVAAALKYVLEASSIHVFAFRKLS